MRSHVGAIDKVKVEFMKKKVPLQEVMAKIKSIDQAMPKVFK